MILRLAGEQKYAIRRGPQGWERWDNFIEAWEPIRPDIAMAPMRVALEYAAGFYGVRQRQVGVDPASPSQSASTT